MKVSALLLDRDNLILECDDYVLSLDDVQLKPGVPEAFQIIKSMDIITCMATKQRCISKGLVSRFEVDKINNKIERLLDFSFNKIYVEESSKLKTRLMGDFLSDFIISPSEVLYIDDQMINCETATKIGFNTICTDNLLEALNSL